MSPASSDLEPLTQPLPPDPTRPQVLLLLGAGQRLYREFGLQQIAEVLPVVLLDSTPAAWAAEYTVAQATTDLANPDLLQAAVHALATEYDIAGVLSYCEEHVVTAAQITAGLGLPGPDPAAVTACRDKAQTRSRLSAAGVPSADSHLVHSEEEAIAVAERAGYPLVVKPRSLAGSVAVRRVDSAAELRAAFQAAASATLMSITALPGVLIEEYVSGPEVSTECVISSSGETRLVAVTRKFLGPEPQFEEVGHTVAAGDVLARDPVLQYVAAQTVAALGLSSCVLHLELRLTTSGPAVIEANARLGGDLIPHLVDLATGISLPRAAAQLATGATPDLLPRRAAAAGIGFTYPEVAGVVEQLHAPGQPSPAWLERAVWTAWPGDTVTPPALGGGLTSRLGHYVVTGQDFATCRQHLDVMATSIAVRIRPSVHAPACVI